MKLVGYELRKALSGRFWWITLLLLILVNLLLYSEPWRGVDFFNWKDISEEYAPLKSFISTATVEEYEAYIAEMYSRYGEYDYYNWDYIVDDSPGRFAPTMTQELQILAYHLNQCASFERLLNERTRIVNDARWSGGTAYLGNDIFGMRKNMDMIWRYAVKPAIIPALATEENSGPSFSSMPKWGWQNFMEYIWGDVLAILLSALLALRVFSSEHQSRAILYATQKGRKQTVAAKFAAAAVLGLGISALFTAIDLLFIWFKDGLYGADGSVLTIGTLSYTPLVCTIAQAALLFALHRIIGVMCVSVICAVISYFVKSALPSYIGGVAFVGISYGYYLLAGQNTSLSTWLRVLPDVTALSRPQWFFETYRVASIFGYPVFWSIVCIGFWSVLCVALSGFAIWHSGRRVRI